MDVPKQPNKPTQTLQSPLRTSFSPHCLPLPSQRYRCCPDTQRTCRGLPSIVVARFDRALCGHRRRLDLSRKMRRTNPLRSSEVKKMRDAKLYNLCGGSMRGCSLEVSSSSAWLPVMWRYLSFAVVRWSTPPEHGQLPLSSPSTIHDNQRSLYV